MTDNSEDQDRNVLVLFYVRGPLTSMTSES